MGRTEVLNQLMAGALGNNVASFYVYGQKRVGKTSLVAPSRIGSDRLPHTTSRFIFWVVTTFTLIQLSLLPNLGKAVRETETCRLPAYGYPYPAVRKCPGTTYRFP